ncbi:MAG: hypothetical protein NT080_01965 [Spirochaetes bacterium]|nr:hypothetical protein [Spirochaetota bacterium]
MNPKLDGRSGSIRMSFRAGRGEYVLTANDDGIGVSEGMDPDRSPGRAVRSEGGIFPGTTVLLIEGVREMPLHGHGRFLVEAVEVAAGPVVVQGVHIHLILSCRVSPSAGGGGRIPGVRRACASPA